MSAPSHSSRRSGSPLVRAFTLIEMLVVIGIIVIVIGFLLPALTAARRAGYNAQCLANLREIANGEAIYEAENKGVLTTDLGNLKILVSGNSSGNSYNKVMYCPGLLQYGVPYNDGGNFTSYGFNGWFSFVKLASLPPSYVGYPIKPSSIRDGSEVVMFADVIESNATSVVPLLSGGASAITDPFTGYLGTPNPTNALKLTLPDFHGRHGSVGSVLWIDGHVSSEIPVSVPSNASGNGIVGSPNFYKSYHIGYLARSQADLTSMGAEYYFVFKKAPLSQNSMSLYTDPSRGLWQ